MTSIAELKKDNECLKDIVKDLKAKLAELIADHQALKLQTNEQCDVITELTQERDNLAAEALTDKAIDRIRSEAYTEGFAAGKPETNFDDANYAFYWAAQNGDVVFWKVPCELMDLEAEEGGSRVMDAFQGERFGDEWGSLSSHTIRTMTLEILEENE